MKPTPSMAKSRPIFLALDSELVICNTVDIPAVFFNESPYPIAILRLTRVVMKLSGLSFGTIAVNAIEKLQTISRDWPTIIAFFLPQAAIMCR